MMPGQWAAVGTARASVLRVAVERPQLGRVLWTLRENVQRTTALFAGRRTLSGKLQRKMRLDRRELLATFADKSAVRAYVEGRVGLALLPKLYGLVDEAADIDLARLPECFVIKPSHGSGAAVIVHPAAPSGRRLPMPARTDWWLHAVTWVRPEDLDLGDLALLAGHWLSRSYLLGGRAYWDLPRRLLVEEFLADRAGRPSPDYRLWVFHGTVRWIQVDLDWTGGLGGGAGVPRRSLHWPDWTPIDVVATRPRPDVLPPRPTSLARMIEVAETLGAETDMVRVDLYELDGRVVFGELTNYPLGGRLRFEPPEYDRILGQWWVPPRRYA